MKKKKYLKWWIAAVSAVFIVGVGIFVYTQYKAAQTSGDVATKDGTSASASDITWNGKTYSYNEHLSNFLFLGIDTKEKAETKTGQADAGQADALYLLSWNRLEGDITVISIPRDTMTQIETFGPGGKSLGKSKDHISLSYAYGDGGYESCELAENAVSELLYGLPIDGYCALSGGIFGSRETARRNGTVLYEPKNKFVKQLVFPSYEVMKTSCPWLKTPILLPAAWLVRYKRALTASRGNIGYHIERAKTFDRVEDQEQKERCQFFERCGLEDVSENF